MGTEIKIYADRAYISSESQVKLNNPLMGTEIKNKSNL